MYMFYTLVACHPHDSTWTHHQSAQFILHNIFIVKQNWTLHMRAYISFVHWYAHLFSWHKQCWMGKTMMLKNWWLAVLGILLRNREIYLMNFYILVCVGGSIVCNELCTGVTRFLAKSKGQIVCLFLYKYNGSLKTQTSIFSI